MRNESTHDLIWITVSADYNQWLIASCARVLFVNTRLGKTTAVQLVMLLLLLRERNHQCGGIKVVCRYTYDHRVYIGNINKIYNCFIQINILIPNSKITDYLNCDFSSITRLSVCLYIQGDQHSTPTVPRHLVSPSSRGLSGKMHYRRTPSCWSWCPWGWGVAWQRDVTVESRNALPPWTSFSVPGHFNIDKYNNCLQSCWCSYNCHAHYFDE